MRIKLAENPNFDIDYIFSEQKETGLITSQDIMDFMRSLLFFYYFFIFKLLAFIGLHFHPVSVNIL